MRATMDGGRATDDATDLIGATFAGREVDAVIGDDMVTIVYRAIDPDSGVVALRLVSQDLCDIDGRDTEPYQRFHRHARTGLTFHHPRAPAIYEVGEYRGRGYVVTAHIDTIPFGAYIDGHGPLRIETALELFEPIADVLDAGHRAGLTHGAVSPLTLRIATSSDVHPATAYVTGHGLGDLLEVRLRRDRKHLEVVDDLLYVAPEQLRRQPTTGRTDQYAMACALVHALTGTPPFVRDSVGGLFGAHLYVPPSFDPESAMSTAILKGLAKEPRDRFASCGQLIADIERALRSAANRRNAANRRRLLAEANGHRRTDEDDQARATTESQAFVVDLDDPHTERKNTEVGIEPADVTARVVIVDLSEAREASAPAPSPDTAASPDDSPPRRRPAATSSGHPKTTTWGRQPTGIEDLDRIPRSELLRGWPPAPPHVHQRWEWRRVRAWVIAVIAVLVLATAAFWLMGS